MTKKKNLSFEEQLQRLEEIVDILDSGDSPLEQQLKDFEEGMLLAQSLREFLEKAELKVIEITQKSNVLEPDADTDYEETED